MKQVITYIVCGLFSVFMPLAFVSASSKPEPKTAKQVNLLRYMGAWYEIASFPNRFQRGCQCTHVHYHLEDGSMRIVNRCYKGPNRVLDEARGKAWPTDKTNSKLKVQFFWPFTGDYWILAVSPRYRWALVGSPDRDYLWILARSRHLSRQQYRYIVNLARRQGFEVSHLVRTAQNCRISRIRK